MMQCFAGIPLLYQPGSKWVYSVSMDIQGYIIEKLSGKPLPEFMQERIFKPLRMTDTAFFVPKENYTDVASEHDVRVVPVGTFGEALAALRS